MEVLYHTLFLLAGGGILYVGAEGLVGGSSRLALRIGLTPLAVGLTVVAFGTSAPELVVSVSATLEGNTGIAAGNVIGSNIANVALILGLCALIRPIQVATQVVRIDTPIMIGVTVVASLLILQGEVGRIQGSLLFASLLAYTLFNYLWAKRSAIVMTAEDLSEGLPEESTNLKDWLWIICGLAGLVVGAQSFVMGAIGVARFFELSDAVIGLSIVALGTSLPELATSLVATWKKEADIVIGNVVGSNVFNLLGVLGAAALAAPISTEAITRVDLGIMFATSVALLPIIRSGLSISRLEGGVLLATYCGYVWWLLVP